MRPGLSGSKDRSLRVSKKEEGTGEARETDPLLSASAGRSLYTGSIRSRRSSRSPALRDSLMNPDDRYTANVASGTFTSNDVYSQDAYELHTDSMSSGSSPKQPQHAGPDRQSRPTQSDDRHVFHLRRTNAVYRPSTGDNSNNLDDNGEPPLLEIPEEIYAVRKAALQVMKPLIGSWVSWVKNVLMFSEFLKCPLAAISFLP